MTSTKHHANIPCGTGQITAMFRLKKFASPPRNPKNIPHTVVEIKTNTIYCGLAANKTTEKRAKKQKKDGF